MTNHQKEQLDKAREYAESRGGSCLSDISEYKNNKSRLTWKCSNSSHPSWSGSFIVLVHQKRWCRNCKYDNHSKNHLALEEANKIASSKNGYCLSKNYINSKTNMLWKCHISHHKSWFAKLSTIKHQNTWCKECYEEKVLRNINKPKRLIKAQQHAMNKNGFCLSKEYISVNHKIKWKCCDPKHKPWIAAPKHVLYDDQWCPECANVKNKTENRVRLFLETYFKFKLLSCRPSWNINPKTGRFLELDGYNQENKIAFEHDGEHHIQITKNFYGRKTNNFEDDFHKQLERDKIKRENCNTHGVKLISIPILDRKKRYRFFELLKHVILCCREQNIFLTYSYSELKNMYKLF